MKLSKIIEANAANDAEIRKEVIEFINKVMEIYKKNLEEILEAKKECDNQGNFDAKDSALLIIDP